MPMQGALSLSKTLGDQWIKGLTEFGNFLISNPSYVFVDEYLVIDYINKYNKKPSAGNIDISIKKLGKWISVQKTNYTKNINCMKDKEIRDTWISFLTDPAYAKYF